MDNSRRTFLGGVAGAGAYALLGETLAQEKPAPAPAPAAPAGTITNEVVKSQKHTSMEYHSDRPLTGSVPAHQHDFAVTPADRMSCATTCSHGYLRGATHGGEGW